jgi:hypothetical protein
MERHSSAKYNIKEEVGIFIVCSDKNLLSIINQIMRHNGLIAVSDTAGRQHYVIDGRSNPTFAARCVQTLVFSEQQNLYDTKLNECNKRIERVISEILDKYHFDKSLMGSSLLTILLRIIYINGTGSSFKKIYSEVGAPFYMNAAQVERNIRYSIRKSDLWSDGVKNIKIYLKLLEDIRKKVKNYDIRGAGGI